MRLERGWRVEDLAKRAECSVKTVENVERGAKVYLATLKRIAEAVGVEFLSLVSEWNTESSPKPDPKLNPKAQQPRTGGKRVEVQIKLSINLDQFDETDQFTSLLQALVRAIAATSEVGAVSIESGSTIIKLEMSEEDAMALVRAYENGRLRELGIITRPVILTPLPKRRKIWFYYWTISVSIALIVLTVSYLLYGLDVTVTIAIAITLLILIFREILRWDTSLSD
jgi:transcriptional regulator with XRE-family HTH domain